MHYADLKINHNPELVTLFFVELVQLYHPERSSIIALTHVSTSPPPHPTAAATGPYDRGGISGTQRHRPV